MSENGILSPEEVLRRRSQRAASLKTAEQFENRGGRVKIDYETMGRFSIPATLYFKDFSVEDESNLLLTTQSDQLETVINILNTLVNKDSGIKIEDMLLDEFMETLIAIEKQFDSSQHTHSWVCSCQYNLDESDQKQNDIIINLNDLTYISIEESDKIIKQIYKQRFDSFSEQDWKNYLYKKYKDNPFPEMDSYTKEQELDKLVLSEPFKAEFENNIFEFRFNRIGDLVKARKIASDKFAKEIKTVQNKRDPNIPMALLKDKKKEEVNKLKYEEIKYSIFVSEALTLLTHNGKVLTDEEKINIYSNVIPRSVKKQIKAFMDQFHFGIQQEQEFVCPLCGKTDKRSLQQEFTFFEFIPSATSTKTKPGEFTGSNIYVGI